MRWSLVVEKVVACIPAFKLHLNCKFVEVLSLTFFPLKISSLAQILVVFYRLIFYGYKAEMILNQGWYVTSFFSFIIVGSVSIIANLAKALLKLSVPRL